MNRYYAKEIAKTITRDQLNDMLERAKQNITDWKKVSCVNKSMSKGCAWNLLVTQEITNPNSNIGYSAKVVLIREFGEFLAEELKIKPVKRNIAITMHQEPKF
jgi:hypothetical protein